MHYMYVLQNVERRDDFYLGSTSNLKRRVAEHNAGNNRSTKGRFWRVIYYEAYSSQEAAQQREQRLKRNRRMRQMLMDRLMRHL